MARRTIDPEGKRKQIGVRFGPQDRAVLDALATAEGVSVGKLIEKRTLALLTADQKTFDLLAAICARIGEAEDVARTAHPAKDRPDKLSWHQDLYAWAAVAEMLARGPIEDRRPESVLTDEGYRHAESVKMEIAAKKREVLDDLSRHGISASLTPSREMAKKGGLFGSILQRYDRRGPERAMIDAIPDDDSRGAAIALHDELKRLDEAEADEDTETSETVKIFRDMESEGRRLFREHDQKQRIAAIMEGIAKLRETLARAKRQREGKR